MIDAIEAVEAAGIGTRADFYATLHAVFVKKHEHTIVFDQAFNIFWRKRGFIEKLIAMMSPQAAEPERAEEAGRRARRASPTPCTRTGREEKPKRSRSSSTRASPCRRPRVLQTKDFAQMTAAEIAAARSRHLATAHARREDATCAAGRPIRTAAASIRARTFRSSLRAGGAGIELAYRAHAERYAADRRDLRHIRLDERLHARLPAFPACADRRSAARVTPSCSARG